MLMYRYFSFVHTGSEAVMPKTPPEEAKATGTITPVISKPSKAANQQVPLQPGQCMIRVASAVFIIIKTTKQNYMT